MKARFKKYAYWVGPGFLYLSLVAAAFFVLFNSDRDRAGTDLPPSAAFSQGQTTLSFLSQFASSRDFSGVLLPMGPDDSQLPGQPAIWGELDKIHRAEFDEHGFAGVQIVRNVADLAKGQIAELFLGGLPTSAFRFGHTLITLNSRGTLHFIDAQDPRSPKIVTTYPQFRVSQIAVRDETIFLLLKDDRLPYTEIAVLDLSNPEAPTEIKRLKLPGEVEAFFFMENLMVTYETVNKTKWHRVHVYQLMEDFRPVSLGQAPVPRLTPFFARFDDYLVVPDTRDGLNIYDFSDPLNPEWVSSVALANHVSRLERFGDSVFALTDDTALSVVRMDDPRQPYSVASFNKGEAYAYIMEWGDYCYYFTSNGYLLVFDTPFSVALASSNSREDTLHPGDFALTGNDGRLVFLQAKVTGRLTSSLTRMLPESVPSILDALMWENKLVVLDKENTVHFLAESGDGKYKGQGRLTLPPGQRWLAAGGDRLFVGGGKTVHVITGQDGRFSQDQQFQVDGEESWDGLVSQGTLYVAEGKNGVLAFPEQHPDQGKRLSLPLHLQPLVDAKQLAATDDGRVLVAAGRVGLLVVSTDDAGETQLAGKLEFAAPALALAGAGKMCFVATDEGVQVVDISKVDSLQLLGRIGYRGVARFAVASDEYWAGYTPGHGWRLLHKPHLMPVDELMSLKELQNSLRQKDAPAYRINLFSDQQVIAVPGIISLSFSHLSQDVGAGHAVN